MDTPANSQDKTQLTDGGEASTLAREFAPGDIVGGSYEVVSFIGAGGMGNVYRVRHTILRVEYALKTLSAEKVNEVAWRRFQNEAQAIARMNHPNIVVIYNLGRHYGRIPYYVMDILQGKTLWDMIRKKGRLETKEALSIFIEVCAGIGYAHKKGIVHRDIKPPNIVLLDKPDPTGTRVKIVDFGIAKLSHTKDLANQQLTSVGEVFGSPFYMSPEQCEAGQIDARSDIYSLGCTLFEALTGRPPFKGLNAMETMLLHGTATPPRLQAASGGIEFPNLLEIAMSKMLAKEPIDRYQNMESVAQDLTRILQGTKRPSLPPKQIPPSKFNPLLFIAPASAILLIAAASLYYFHSSMQKPLPNTKNKDSLALSAFDTYTTDSGAPKAQSERGEMKPFSKIVSGGDGQTYLQFDFPKDESIGLIGTSQDDKRSDCQKGTIKLPAGTIVFEPGNAFTIHPEYFQRFGEGDLAELEIDSDQCSRKIDNTMLKFLPHLKALQKLTIRGCHDIDDKAVAYIEQIPAVRSFDCDESNISVDALSRSPMLRRLTTLKVSCQGNVSPLLKALQGSPKLTDLEIRAAHLTYSDYQLIGTLSNLKSFNCNDSGMHDQDVIALTALKHLKRLSAENNYLTAEAIPALKKLFARMKGYIDIKSNYIKPQDFLRIKQALPGVTFDLNDGSWVKNGSLE